jgi:hypothetical protein
LFHLVNGPGIVWAGKGAQGVTKMRRCLVAVAVFIVPVVARADNGMTAFWRDHPIALLITFVVVVLGLVAGGAMKNK